MERRGADAGLLELAGNLVRAVFRAGEHQHRVQARVAQRWTSRAGFDGAGTSYTTA